MTAFESLIPVQVTSQKTQSGFIAAPGVVITAAHGIDPDTEVSIRRPGESTSDPARLVWCGDFEQGGPLEDIAVLSFDAQKSPGHHVRWVKPLAHKRLQVRMLGFPSASSDGTLRSSELEAIDADAILLTENEPGLLQLDVQGSLPLTPAGWEGLSGAVLLSADGRVAGMLVRTKSGWRHDRLQAIPAQAVLRPEVAQVLAEADAAPQASFDCPIVKPAHIATDLEAPHVPVSWYFQSRRAVVPFVEEGQAETMDALRSWCEAAEPLGVKHLVGTAGSGKTRLAAELCQRMEHESGWIAGFSHEGAQEHWDVYVPNRHLLIVFDYAQQWEQEIQAFLRQITTLLDEGRLRSKVRVLLLSRSTGDLIERCDHRSVLATLRQRDLGFTLELKTSGFTGDRRRAHLEAAFRMFCSPEFGPASTPTLPDVEDAQYSSPLLVHIAAYFGSQGDSVPRPGSSDIQSTLLTQLLQREGDIWLELANKYGDRTFRSREQASAAVLILSLARPQIEEAGTLLSASPSWEGASVLDRRDAAKATSHLYPSPETPAITAPSNETRIGALEPDLLLEHLLATFPDRNRLLRELHDHKALRAPHRARFLQVLALTRDHYPSVEGDFQNYIGSILSSLVDDEDADKLTVGELLVASMPQLIEGAAVKIRKNEGNQVANYLASAIQYCDANPDLAERCSEASIWMPRPNPEISNLSLVLAERSIEYAETVPDRKAIVAMLHRLGLFQADCGEWSRSMMSARRAIGIVDDLPEHDVDHLQMKALNLNLLGAGLCRFDRPAEAASALKAGLEISAEHRADHPDKFDGIHVELSANLARVLSETGDAASALEMLQLLQEESEAESPQHRIQLLNNRGLFHQQNGDLDESLTLLEAAASVCRILAGQRLAQHRQLLVEVLQNLSGTYSRLGRRTDALEASKEAAGHAQQLHDLNANAYVGLLAGALDNLGIDLLATGAFEEAIPVIERSLQLIEDRVEADQAIRSSYAKIQANLAQGLALTGDLDGAMEVLTSAIGLQRELVARSPQTQRETLREMTGQLRDLIEALESRDRRFGLGGGDS
ncbi:tetratricopeptide repeat protein [Glycomyces sp. NPDC047010]|uniref:tetratricopeptide repeat protein n=1 Tax=Glycomyces sp. NPDC047010 TaxID=3155023 RepID=UPI0033F226AE